MLPQCRVVKAPVSGHLGDGKVFPSFGSDAACAELSHGLGITAPHAVLALETSLAPKP